MKSSNTSSPKGNDPHPPLPSDKEYSKRTQKRSSSPNKPINSFHTTKQDQTNEQLDFVRNLNPPNHIEHTAQWGRQFNNNLKKDLQENPSLGFRLQMRTPLLPTRQVHTSNKERREIISMVSYWTNDDGTQRRKARSSQTKLRNGRRGSFSMKISDRDEERWKKKHYPPAKKILTING